MKHYTEEQWQEYRCGKLENAIAVQMENHLLECPICLERFLGLIDVAEVAQADRVLSTSFTQDTMSLLKQSENLYEIRRPNHAPHRPSSKKLFGYYVAAAILTVALMGGGVFETAVDQYPSLTAMCTVNNQTLEKGLKLPYRLENSEQWFQTLITKGGITGEQQK